ncbi:MAG: hypothetical protein AB7G21_04775, partial [Dehalococcoidia bacterium]
VAMPTAPRRSPPDRPRRDRDGEDRPRRAGADRTERPSRAPRDGSAAADAPAGERTRRRRPARSAEASTGAANPDVRAGRPGVAGRRSGRRPAGDSTAEGTPPRAERPAGGERPARPPRPESSTPGGAAEGEEKRRRRRGRRGGRGRGGSPGTEGGAPASE